MAKKNTDLSAKDIALFTTAIVGGIAIGTTVGFWSVFATLAALQKDT